MIKYFTPAELMKTNVGLKNYPTEWQHLKNIERLARYLDSIRERLGSPIRVNSGYRTISVNNAVKGAKNSYHTLGLAADICAADGAESTNRRLLQLLLESNSYDQLISYHTHKASPASRIRFIHIGLAQEGDVPRKQFWHQ